MNVTTIRLPEHLSEELDRLAEKYRTYCLNPNNQAAKEYVMHTHTDAKRWQETLAALESAKAGHLVQGEEVKTWLSGWGRTTLEKSRR